MIPVRENSEVVIIYPDIIPISQFPMDSASHILNDGLPKEFRLLKVYHCVMKPSSLAVQWANKVKMRERKQLQM
jgi:hypothetical protein